MGSAGMIAAIALVGCNALTGASDLDLVDCVQCGDSAVEDSSSAEETAAIVDSAVVDTNEGDGDAADGDATDGDARTCTTDLDCDDRNACTRDNCAGFVRSCTNRIIDADGDGEAATTLGTCGLDCNDNDRNVHPKQVAYFAVPYVTPTSMLPSYDYNCDGAAEPEFVGTGKCTLVGTACTLTAGWSAATVACGKAGKWLTACTKSSLGCLPTSVDRTQTCR